MAISCAFEDRPTIVRIIRQLQTEHQQYRVLLDSLLGLGNTAQKNSQQLIRESEAVLIIASRAYINSAVHRANGNISTEVQEIYARNTSERTPVVALAVDSYESLKNVQGWDWSKLNSNWVSGPPILHGPLRHAGDTSLHEAVKAAIQDLNKAA